MLGTSDVGLKKGISDPVLMASSLVARHPSHEISHELRAAGCEQRKMRLVTCDLRPATFDQNADCLAAGRGARVHARMPISSRLVAHSFQLAACGLQFLSPVTCHLSRFFFSLCLASCVLCPWFSRPAEAVELQPLRLELSARSGEPLGGEFRLVNDRAHPVTVTVASDRYPVVPFSETSSVVEPPSCSSWISVAPVSVEVAPGQVTSIRYQIVVPAGVTQEHVGAIRFDVDQAVSDAASSTPGHGQLQVTMRLIVPVYVAIEGYRDPRVSIGQVVVSQAGDTQRLKIAVGLVNDGPVHVRPFGHVTIMNEDRRVVATLPIGRTPPLLPGQRGDVPVYWKPEMPGRYIAVAVVNIDNIQLVEQQQAFLFEGWL